MTMAVCRFSETCDVYVYYDVGGGIICCGCILSQRHAVNMPDEKAMTAHLKEHIAVGHKVPSEAFDRLESPTKF